ncbi:MAG: ABC transporter permease [Acidobacteria bacterium]|nr:ABC transporter permease [Acidobacteriota bacterium]
MTGLPPPPKLARRLLALALPADVRDPIADDLAEVYRRLSDQQGATRARRWYWREALAFAGGFLMERLRERATGRSPITTTNQDRRGPMRGLFESWTTDFTHAARRLLRAPGFTLVTVATLALAIGANTAIFSVVDAVLIDPLPYPNADRLVTIRGTAPGSDLPGEFPVGPEFFVSYRDEADLIEDIGMYQAVQSTARTDDRVDRLFMVGGSSSLFTTLGVKPLLGRLPTKEDDAQRAPVMVISHSLWTTWFASDPAILGRSFEASGTKRTVIGVMGPEFRFPDSRTSVWMRASIADEKRITPGRLGFQLVARTKPGVKTPDVTAQLATIAKRLPERFGGTARYAQLIAQHHPVVRSLEEDVVGDVARPLWIVLGTVGIVFLIACANVANLFIVRSESRRRDLAVRSALGAGRAGLIRSQMAEALLLALLGGAGGALVASLGVPLLVSAAPEGVPNLDLVALSPLSVLFTAGLTILAACVFGLLPAIRFSRPQALGDLRQTGRIGSPQGRLARHALVVLQTASALVLLVAAGLLARSFWELSRVDLGYKTDNIFTFQVAPQRPQLNDGPTFAQFHQGLMEKIAAMPGVESVGLVNELPLDEGSGMSRFATEATDAAGATAPLVPFSTTGGDYFKTMSIPLVSGRLFERPDHAVGMSNALVSRAAAQRFWPNEDPIGKRFRFGSDPATGTWHTVVGVVGDIRLRNFRQEAADPMIYLPMVGPTARTWVVGSPAYVVKSTRAASLAPEIRALLREYAPEAPMYRIFTMEGLADRALAQLTFTTLILAIASGLALVLGAVGLYGVLSYVVSQRTREIAVRMALGAERSAVRRMVVLQGGRVALLGVGVGILVALGVTSVLKSLLFGVNAFDAVTFIAMSVVMLLVAMLASYIPAYRASSVDPMQALRGD